MRKCLSIQNGDGDGNANGLNVKDTMTFVEFVTFVCNLDQNTHTHTHTDRKKRNGKYSPELLLLNRIWMIWFVHFPKILSAHLPFVVHANLPMKMQMAENSKGTLKEDYVFVNGIQCNIKISTLFSLKITSTTDTKKRGKNPTSKLFWNGSDIRVL